MTAAALAALTGIEPTSPLDLRLDALSDLLSALAESPSLHLRRQVLTVAAEVMPISSIGYGHLKRSTLLLLDRASLPLSIADEESRT